MDQYWDILLLAAIAGFFLFRLRNVLGRRTGHEDPANDWPKSGESKPENNGRKFEKPQDNNPRENVVRLGADDKAPTPVPEAEADGNIGRIADEGSVLYTTLKSILSLDHSFDAEQFLDGSRAAYKMIIEAFGAGDMKSLKGLLGDEVQNSFETSLEERQSSGEADRKEVVGIIAADLITASLEDQLAELSVKFQAEIRSLDHEVEHPDEEEGEEVAQISLTTDIWTFSRDLESHNPNWQLTATRSVH